jgi:hypothetical protein
VRPRRMHQVALGRHELVCLVRQWCPCSKQIRRRGPRGQARGWAGNAQCDVACCLKPHERHDQREDATGTGTDPGDRRIGQQRENDQRESGEQ